MRVRPCAPLAALVLVAALGCNSGGGSGGGSSGGGVASTASSGGLGIVGADDFNVCALDPEVWTFVDPRGDSSVGIVGAGSGNAQLRIAVPAGQSHDPWGTNRAARLVQAAPAGDFQLEAKFDSPVSERYQMQGLLVEGDPGSWVRLDVHHDGSGVRLFAASVTGGTGTVQISTPLPATFPVLLRLARAGSQWTASHSHDGASWQVDGSFSHAIAARSLGVFAGNAGANPAHAALVDYFTRIGPIPGEDQASVPSEVVLVVHTAGNGAVSASPDRSRYACGTTVTLAAQPASGWSFTGWSGHLSGSQNPETILLNGDREVTAGFATSSGAPVISNLRATNVTSDSAVIEWSTDQPATSVVAYGVTKSYELGTIEQTALVTQHAVALSGLAAGTQHHYRATSRNASNAGTTSGNQKFTTAAAGGGGSSDPGGPVIDVWYGDEQRFGDIGVPQPHVNVLGNASDPDGVASLSYRLNGGTSVALSQGPDGRRLADPGDFNADIAIGALRDGTNTVAITAVDSRGNATTRNVDVVFDSGSFWPRSYAVDWSRTGAVTDVAQVVDGLWEIDRGALRPVQVDYDRLVAIGDMDWDDYEVTAPITIHGYSPDGFDQFSSRPGVGLLLRWVQHTPPGQPARGFELGAIGFYRFGENGINRLEMWTHDSTTTPGVRRDLPFGIPHVFKMQVETSGGTHRYRLKVWPQGQAEPAEWDLVEDQPSTAAPRGALLLVAHHVDASFGNVTIRPL